LVGQEKVNGQAKGVLQLFYAMQELEIFDMFKDNYQQEDRVRIVLQEKSIPNLPTLVRPSLTPIRGFREPIIAPNFAVIF
jgi:hypothetical protein